MKQAFLVFIALVIATGAAASPGPDRPNPATPLGGTADDLLILQQYPGDVSDYMDRSIQSDLFQDGADRLATLQNNDGGWDWPLDDGNPNSASPINTIGPIGKGLARAYLRTLDAAHLSALSDAGALLLTKLNNFSASDGCLAAQLDAILGGSTYTDHVMDNFYTPLANGTYDRNGAGTLYDTAGYVQLIRDARASQSIPNLAAWDVGMGVVGAVACGADETEWVLGTEAEINELDGDAYYDVLGLAGAVYGLAVAGADFDPTAGEHAGASSLADLAGILESYQLAGGGFTWNSNYTDPSDQTTQETAYAILALDAVDRPGFLTDIANAGGWLFGTQLGTGGWAGYVGDAENNEITGEALWGIDAASSEITEVWVDDDFDSSTPGWGITHFASIQDAIDAVSGSTVNVAAGVYEEQVVIDEDLTLIGAGVGSTIIRSPVSLAESFNTGSNDNYPVIFVNGANADISELTVDGAGRGNLNYRFCGVAFWNGGGSLSNAEVIGVRDTPFSGAQHGVGVYAFNDTGGPYTVALNGVVVTDFQKTAVALNGDGLTVDLDDVTTTGAGPTGITAQNGIQVGFDASGTIDDSMVEDLAYTGGGYSAAGLLVLEGAYVDITGTDVDGCQTSVYFSNGSGSFNGGTVTNPLGDALYAFSLGYGLRGEQPRAQAHPFDMGLPGAGYRSAVSVSLTGSTFTGADVTNSWGPSAYAIGPVDFTMAGCTVTHWDYGVVCYEDGGTVTGEAHGNNLEDNGSYGMYSNTAVDFDATGNWWGNATGPYHPSLNPGGTGNEVSDHVDFDPWSGLADLSVLPAANEPINCSQSVTLSFDYTPDIPFTPAMRGFSVTVDASSELSFSESDISLGALLPGVGDPYYFDIVDNLDGTFTVDGGILGPTSGITTAGTLFTVTFHGAATGTGDALIASYFLRDLNNVDFFASTSDAEVLVDCVAPGAASGIAAAPGYQKVNVTWTDPGDGDLTLVEIWRGMWYDTAPGTSAYPEYDDLAGDVIPTRPASRAAADASPEWVLAGTAAPGAESFVDNWVSPRGVYYYEVFAKDVADNYGPPAAANDRATNYWLGDLPSFVDGYVNASDVTVLAAAYGTDDGDGSYNNECDIGPTDDNGGFGIPETDSSIGFEDLMIISLTYSYVAPAPQSQGSDIAHLTWYRVDERRWALGLLEPCRDLKGLRLTASLPEGATAAVTPGLLLTQQEGPHFLINVNALDISLAMLGQDATVTGQGELLRVTLPAGATPGAPELVLRSSANADVEYLLEATAVPEIPTSYSLAGCYPNPFNPKTSISFALVEGQAVKLLIFDAEGRRVTTVVDAFMAAGYHTAVWDGRDASGQPVSSGVYFCRIDAGPLHETAKMLLLK